MKPNQVGDHAEVAVDGRLDVIHECYPCVPERITVIDAGTRRRLTRFHVGRPESGHTGLVPFCSPRRGPPDAPSGQKLRDSIDHFFWPDGIVISVAPKIPCCIQKRLNRQFKAPIRAIPWPNPFPSRQGQSARLPFVRGDALRIGVSASFISVHRGQREIAFPVGSANLSGINITMTDNSRESIERRVVELFVETTKLDVAQFQSELLLADTGIDSLGLVELIFAIEDEYDISIQFNANEQGRSAAAFESVGQLMDQVVALVQAKQSETAEAA
ncbi:acyl carrier protein [Variovorax sp. GT1P44]|uniref:acyl carrier protein n=1 Tax=Variovorax sp. GT1P44 TaxID=3443742 RepID=UPI003F4458AF